LQKPVQCPAYLLGILACVGQVSVDVLDGGFDDVQRVTELIELAASHDELRLAQTELSGSATGFVVALLAALATEQARPPRTTALGQLPPAPAATT
jgi:hypothetical protein